MKTNDKILKTKEEIGSKMDTFKALILDDLECYAKAFNQQEVPAEFVGYVCKAYKRAIAELQTQIDTISGTKTRQSK